MKKIFTTISATLWIASPAVSQNNLRHDESIRVENKNVHALNTFMPSSATLSRFMPDQTPCISPEQEAEIKSAIKKNIGMLREKNPGACQKTSMVHPQFIWPIQPKAGFTGYGYYSVTNFADHDLNYNNNLEDYNCGNRTYDWASGNHEGTDIILWPYSWLRMDEQVMEVVAAAPGVIINKVDGNFDRNCVMNGSTNYNAIFVQHDDGSIAWYLHFKTGSLTSKIVGDSVAAGEYLATAGSSGSSTVPHLHFQVFDDLGNLIDPYDGPCNSTNPGDSWWQTQQNYMVPAVNHICSGSNTFVYNCPDPEITNEKYIFNPGDTLYLSLFYRDLDSNALTHINIYNPASTITSSWDFYSPWAFGSSSWAYWYFYTTSAWMNGAWIFEATFNGQVYQHQFYMNNPVGVNEFDVQSSMFNVYPSPVSSELTIQLVPDFSGSSDKIEEIKISDVIGKSVYSNYQIKSNHIKLQTSNLSDGVYFVQMKSGNKTATQKIVVRH